SSEYGEPRDRRSERDRRPPATRRQRRSGGPRRALGAASQAAAADGPPASRPAAPGAGGTPPPPPRGGPSPLPPALPARPRSLPPYLWVRLVTGQRLVQVHRHHLGTAMRDAGREVSLYRGALPQASSVSLAAQLLGRFSTASHAAVRAERQLQLQAVLNA